jgi:hypothetical protein
LKWTAARLFPKRYGDKMELLGQGDTQQPLTISWIKHDAPDPEAPPSRPPPPPKQLTYQPVPPPADLSAEDWSTLDEILALTKRTIPSDGDTAPAEVLEVLRKALLDHFAAKP